MTALQIDDLPATIRGVKKRLREQLPDHARVFAQLEADMREQAADIAELRRQGRPVIPEIAYADIAQGRVSEEQARAVRKRGACVIRRVFDPATAQAWDAEIADYVLRNDLDARLAHRAEDKYFGQLASSKPQIYGV